VAEPAYTRLNVDERRRQVLVAAGRLFTENAFEEITMREIAAVAGISKALLYHYFPSKTELFKAAAAQYAGELQALIAPDGEGTPIEQLSRSLDAYLGWIQANSQAWVKLMQSAATLPEAGEFLESFRDQTLSQILEHLAAGESPPPLLRNALNGWLGYVDGTLLDWTQHEDLSRAQIHGLIVTAFGAAVFAVQQADPALRLGLA